jgi:hypothetical protein
MKKLLKYSLVISIILILFLVNYIPHHNQMPQHVDSWIFISWAKSTLDDKRLTFIEPFSSETSHYPLGTRISLAVTTSITGLDMIHIAQFLPAIFFAILGLLLYSLSRRLFNNCTVAIVITAFTPLALSNITMLGPYYLVPVAWGMLLSLLFFYFFISSRWLFSLITLIAIVNTHTSSLVFSLIGVSLYFIFNRQYWLKIKYLFLIIFTAIIFFSLTIGYRPLFSLIVNFFAFEKQPPYISVYLTLPVLFLVLQAIGFYLILIREKKAAHFLIPLFSVLAINAFLYWNWKGFFLVYRRLFTFSFMVASFFVGYAVYTISETITNLLTRTSPKWQFLKKNNLLLITLLFILVPPTIHLNLKAHKYSEIYVDNEEHILLTRFGQLHPESYITTNHLQAYALPYYNLKPVQLSPMHISNISYFHNVSPCFYNRDIKCLESFFNRTNFKYLYTQTLVNSTYFKPAFNYSNHVIYEFVGNSS